MKKFIAIAGTILIVAVAGVILYKSPADRNQKILYWTDPMMPGYRSDKPGKSPMGMELVPVYEGSADTSEIEYYTCAMHPQIRKDKPGNCPICSMKLIPVRKGSPNTGRIFVSPEKQQLIGVKTEAVEFRPLAATIRAVGRVDYAEPRIALVTLRTGGWIHDLFVDFIGKHVTKGEPLFTVYSPELVSAEQEYLLARSGVQESSWTAAQDSSLLKISRERLRLWQLGDQEVEKLEQTGEPMTYVTIRSPISGYVTEKTALKGMRIEPGAALYKIADLSTVWVYADVYEYELPFVKVGQQADIEFPYGGTKLSGKIIYILPFLDPATRAQRVRLEFPNPGNSVKPDMFVTVRIRTNLGKRLSVPREAVLNTGTRKYVFVDRGGGYFEPRSVSVSGETDEFFSLSGGVKEGERVVTAANFLLDSESRLMGVFDQMDSVRTP